ncbi:MAG: D-alanyl-D-alanine carboxypeptidase [Acidimicrobiia bacterium]
MKSVVPVCCIGLGLTLGIVGYVDTPNVSSATAANPTRGLNIRRMPFLAARSAGRAHSRQEALAALGSTNGCFVASDGDGAPLVSVHEQEAEIPASTLKLITGIAALHILGPETTLETEILATALPKQGHVEDLWIRGHGDPSWATPDFIAWEATQPFGKGAARTSIDDLVSEIAQLGITSIANLHGDSSMLTGPPFLPQWKASYRSDGEVGAISALTINRGLEAYRGARAVAPDGAALFATLLTESLHQRGITVGTHDTAPTPDTAQKLRSHSSPAMKDLVASDLRTSDNLASELFLRAIGAKLGDPTTAGGIRGVQQALTDLGISTVGFSQVDGSGLARENTVACPTLVAALDVLHTDFNSVEALAQAGETGTLAGVGPPLKGRLLAKTGSLSGVDGLTGYIAPNLLTPETDPDSQLDDPETVQFALLLNDNLGQAQGAVLRLRIAEGLAAAQPPPDGSALLPAP